MNPLHLSTPGKTDSFRGILAFRPTRHSSDRFRKSFTSRQTSRSSFLLEFPVWSPRSGSGRGGMLLVSACSRRSSQRRSFLREKLIEEGKVRNYPTFHIPDSNLNEKNSVSNTKPEFFPEQASNDIENVRADKTDVLDEFAIRSRLEDWVHRYKKDTEYWGVGSGPIFTIFEDLDRNVRRVSVDEAEILRRHEVRGESPDLNTKIAQAKRIAEEAETGKYEFPRSSPIAKFVAEGTRPLTVDPLLPLPIRSALLPKVMRIGIAMLCGCFVLWALKWLFTSQNDGKKLTRFQKEMLRRKMKSRMEKGTIVDGNVEVLANNSAESEAAPLERPQLDKQKLMASIFESKASSGNATVQESGDITAKDRDFNSKILEFQGMARQARELEQKNPSPLIDNDNESSKAIDGESDVLDSGDDKNASMLLEKSNVDASSENQSNLNGNMRGGVLEKMDGERGTDFPRNLLDHSSTDNCKRDGSRSFIETSANAKDGDSSSKNGHLGIKAVKNGVEILPDPSERETDAINELGTAEETPSYDSSDKKVSPSGKMKPMVIISVEEAREYLSRTPDSLTAKEQTGVQGQVGGHFISPNAPITWEEEQPKQKLTDTNSEETHSNNEEPVTRQARELEQQNPSLLIHNDNENSKAIDVEVESDVLNSNDDKKADMLLKKSTMDAGSENQSSLSGNIRGDLLVKMADAKMDGEDSPDDCKRDATRSYNETSANAKDVDSSSTNRHLEIKAPKNGIEFLPDPSERETDAINKSDTAEEMPSYDSSNQKVSPSNKMKPRIILSVEEAREYLSQTHHTLSEKEQTNIQAQVRGHSISSNTHSSLEVEHPKQKVTEAISEEIQSHKEEAISEETQSHVEESNGKASPGNRGSSEPYEGWTAPLHTNMEKRYVADNLSNSRSSSHNSSAGDNLADIKLQKTEQHWMEKNIHEFEPLVKRVGMGFRENYIEAKEKAQELMESGYKTPLGSLTQGEDLSWMEDDNLREIVFKVRENELAGRDPFHLMNAEDKQVFFKGLEKKVEKANDKLAVLHEFIHSKVENVDYGSDVISVYDPPEKIIPRWKGPLPSEDPEFLNNFMGQKSSPFSENIGMSRHKNGDAMGPQESEEQSSETPPAYGITNLRKLSGRGASTNPRTIIEGSDGSIKDGKKSGKEQWEHTKKWTRQFLEVYQSETDPEMKSILKDMGKDLDRWTTDKDVQQAAELMDRIPKRRRKIIEKKVNKLKREVEMFGSQAVVSKYKEYLEEKEPDYLWWLDLPFVLSIELYTIEDNVPRAGFYSLEMAEDLELNPKQYHVIAFEDPQDCKHLCHIIQDHMDLHGNGSAFVVAQPPKVAYREAKANGFNITVIRKGELQLNVDRTLEEVEDEIIEIGSKMYHDKIMRERGVSIDGLLKGIVRADRASGRTPKKKIGKPTTSGSGRPTARGFGRPTNH